MKNQIEQIVHFREKLDAKSPDAVIDAVDDAVSSSKPFYRYSIHGGPFQVDPLAVRSSYVRPPLRRPSDVWFDLSA